MNLEGGNNTKEYRIRVDEYQLKFLLIVLHEAQESNDMMIPFYRQWRIDHKKDRDRLSKGSEYDKASNAYSDVRKRKIALEDVIRRFESLLAGGRPRPSRWSTIAGAMVIERAEHTTPMPSDHDETAHISNKIYKQLPF